MIQLDITHHWLNIDQICNTQNTPHISPSKSTMGCCLLCVFWRKQSVLWWNHIVQCPWYVDLGNMAALVWEMHWLCLMGKNLTQYDKSLSHWCKTCKNFTLNGRYLHIYGVICFVVALDIFIYIFAYICWYARHDVFREMPFIILIPERKDTCISYKCICVEKIMTLKLMLPSTKNMFFTSSQIWYMIWICYYATNVI